MGTQECTGKMYLHYPIYLTRLLIMACVKMCEGLGSLQLRATEGAVSALSLSSLAVKRSYFSSFVLQCTHDDVPIHVDASGLLPETNQPAQAPKRGTTLSREEQGTFRLRVHKTEFSVQIAAPPSERHPCCCCRCRRDVKLPCLQSCTPSWPTSQSEALWIWPSPCVLHRACANVDGGNSDSCQLPLL